MDLFLKVYGLTDIKVLLRLSSVQLIKGTGKKTWLIFTNKAKIIGTVLRLEKWECFLKGQIWGRTFCALGTA